MSSETTWKILPCPIHAGKHPLHDHRYIVTADTTIETYTNQFGEDTFQLTEGQIICTMHDGEQQARNARLIASAPEMFQALYRAKMWLGRLIADGGHLNSVGPQHAINTLDMIEELIDRIGGKP